MPSTCWLARSPALVQCLSEGPSSTVPLIGASGAIAGVLGLYLVSYPRAWVTVLLPVLFFFWAFDLPAIVVLGFWFVAQFFQGTAAITTASHATTTASVAVWAHVAGFVFGAVVARLLPRAAAAGADRRTARRARSGAAGLLHGRPAGAVARGAAR